jgi:hypothetical protein
VCGEAALGRHGGGDGLRPGGKRCEERVTLGAHDRASVLGDRAAHDSVVVVEHRAGAVTQGLQQRGGALDVGEQVADGSGG